METNQSKRKERHEYSIYINNINNNHMFLNKYNNLSPNKIYNGKLENNNKDSIDDHTKNSSLNISNRVSYKEIGKIKPLRLSPQMLKKLSKSISYINNNNIDNYYKNNKFQSPKLNLSYAFNYDSDCISSNSENETIENNSNTGKNDDSSSPKSKNRKNNNSNLKTSEIIILLFIKSILISKSAYKEEYNSDNIQEAIIFMIKTKEGSIFLQEIISNLGLNIIKIKNSFDYYQGLNLKKIHNQDNKLSNNIYRTLYKFISKYIQELITHQYANYFLQQLFFKLNLKTRILFLKEIFNNIEKLILSSNALCAIVYIIENDILPKEKQIILNYIHQLYKENIFYNNNFLRLLECIVYCYNEKEINFLVEYTLKSNIFQRLIEIREGYFYLRAIVKITKNKNIQNKLINLLSEDFYKIISISNGSLLCQCIIYNFPIDKYIHNKLCSNYAVGNNSLNTNSLYVEYSSASIGSNNKLNSNKTNNSTYKYKSFDESNEPTKILMKLIFTNKNIWFLKAFKPLFECAIREGKSIFEIRLMKEIKKNNIILNLITKMGIVNTIEIVKLIFENVSKGFMSQLYEIVKYQVFSLSTQFYNEKTSLVVLLNDLYNKIHLMTKAPDSYIPYHSYNTSQYNYIQPNLYLNNVSNFNSNSMIPYNQSKNLFNSYSSNSTDYISNMNISNNPYYMFNNNSKENHYQSNYLPSNQLSNSNIFQYNNENKSQSNPQINNSNLNLNNNYKHAFSSSNMTSKSTNPSLFFKDSSSAVNNDNNIDKIQRMSRNSNVSTKKGNN